MPHALFRATTTAIALLGFTASAIAAEPVHVAPEVAYSRDDVGSEAMRAECTWNTLLVDELVRHAKGTVVVTDEDLATVGGRVLKLEVVNVHAIGGGGFSGPKWAVVRGFLTGPEGEDRSFEIRRTTKRGWDACGVLDRIAQALGKDIAGWIANPQSNYPAAPTDVIPAQAAPTGAIPEQAATPEAAPAQ